MTVSGAASRGLQPLEDKSINPREGGPHCATPRARPKLCSETQASKPHVTTAQSLLRVTLTGNMLCYSFPLIDELQCCHSLEVSKYKIDFASPK